MSLYESIFIARQDASPGQVETITTQMTEIVTGLGGKVTKTEQWGLRPLSYKIKKNRKGHYVLMNIDAPSAAIVEMERNMGISEDVLRYMTVKVDKLEDGPSAIIANKDRVDRPGFDRDSGGGGRFDRGGDRPRRFDNVEG